MRKICRLLFPSMVLLIFGVSSLFSQSQDVSDSIVLSFVGGADIQKAISQESGIPANTGVGFIFNRITPQKGKIKLFSDFTSYAYLNIASTADTIVAEYDNSSGAITNLDEFGSYFLIPSNSKLTATASFKGYFYSDKTRLFKRKSWIGNVKDLISGFSFTATGSNRVVSFPQSIVTENFNDSTYTEYGPVRNASVLLFRFGVFHEFIPDQLRLKKDYSVIFGIDFSSRHIFGDLGQDKNDDLRKQLFDTDQKTFLGMQPYLSFRFKNIIAEVSLAMLWKHKGEDMPGLTYTRMVTSIKFVGGFPIKLD